MIDRLGVNLTQREFDIWMFL